MSQHEIELILTRQFASNLAFPAFLVGADGTLLYFNEAAEALLGQRFDETGEMPASEWGTIFTPTDESGQAIASSELPLVVAMETGRPAHRRFYIRGLDGERRQLEVTAVPLVGQAGRFLGGLALFWEVS